MQFLTHIVRFCLSVVAIFWCTGQSQSGEGRVTSFGQGVYAGFDFDGLTVIWFLKHDPIWPEFSILPRKDRSQLERLKTCKELGHLKGFAYQEVLAGVYFKSPSSHTIAAPHWQIALSLVIFLCWVSWKRNQRPGLISVVLRRTIP